jgi:glycosyltransferase involved in cell wall biosynthesis
VEFGLIDPGSKFAPFVSVAMITYNHEQFITKAIEGVLAQRTSFPIELVIGEDASSDDTRRHIEVLRTQAPEVIRSLLRPTNIGMHRNLEGVLEESRGEFVAFLEGDDYWTSDKKLELQVDVLRRHETAVGVFHPVKLVDPFGRETGEIFPDNVETEIRTEALLKGNCIPTASVMIRRSALVSLPDSYRKLIGRDWPMWVHASLHGPWLALPEVMASYRVHDGGVWSGMSAAARLAGEIQLYREFAARLPCPFSAVARQRLVHKHIAAMEAALVCDELANARRELQEIVRLLSYCPISDSRRLISATWKTLSPQTHRVVKRMLGLI